jgi:HemY protein
MQRLWARLGEAQRQTPDLAIQAAQHWLVLKGEPSVARAWLKPIWLSLQQDPAKFSKAQELKLIQALDQSLTGSDNSDEKEWLIAVESAQIANPRNALLQYLAGRLCQKRQLWGKAQALLSQVAPILQDANVRRQAWRSLAELAEQREDLPAALQALKKASLD